MGLFKFFHSNSEELPYCPSASEEIDKQAATLFNGPNARVVCCDTIDFPSVTINGPCPRCGHVFSQTQQLDLAPLVKRGSGNKQKEIVQEVDFLCECGVTHPGAPSGDNGCGASFRLTIPN